MTKPKTHLTKAKAVMDTWGRYCDKLMFVSTEKVQGANDTLLIRLPEETRKSLWKKSQIAWMHLYSTMLEEGDWFLRTDDGKCIYTYRYVYVCFVLSRRKQTKPNQRQMRIQEGKKKHD